MDRIKSDESIEYDNAYSIGDDTQSTQKNTKNGSALVCLLFFLFFFRCSSLFFFSFAFSTHIVHPDVSFFSLSSSSISEKKAKCPVCSSYTSIRKKYMRDKVTIYEEIRKYTMRNIDLEYQMLSSFFSSCFEDLYACCPFFSCYLIKYFSCALIR